MSYIPSFLTEPVPGTGTSLWLLIVLLAVGVGLATLIAAVFGGAKRQDI